MSETTKNTRQQRSRFSEAGKKAPDYLSKMGKAIERNRNAVNLYDKWVQGMDLRRYGEIMANRIIKERMKEGMDEKQRKFVLSKIAEQTTILNEMKADLLLNVSERIDAIHNASDIASAIKLTKKLQSDVGLLQKSTKKKIDLALEIHVELKDKKNEVLDILGQGYRGTLTGIEDFCDDLLKILSKEENILKKNGDDGISNLSRLNRKGTKELK